MTILFCDCNHDRACIMHSHDLYSRAVEVADYDAERQAFMDAGADFYLPGWTPDDKDARERDAQLLASME